MTKISVYITNYNYGKYIQEAIESVLNQSEKDIELIIIDDGSTDNSKSIIEKYVDHDKVIIIYQQNKGLNASNNVARRVSSGKYIVRLDADDYFHQDALKELSAVLDLDDSIGMVFPDYFIVDSDSNIVSEIKRHNFNKDVTLYDQPAHGACTMVRVDYLNHVGGYDECFSCQDGYDLWIKFIMKYKIRNVRKSLFFYRKHGKNLTENEHILLETRAKIKERYLELNKKEVEKSVGIIPIRSLTIDSSPLKEIGGKTLLEIKIGSALRSKLLGVVVIVGSDDEIENIVKQKIMNKRVKYVVRPKELGRYNASLKKTIEIIFSDEEIKVLGLESFVIMSVEFPFLRAKSIDDIVQSSEIFKVNSIISVRPMSDTLYTHSGSGMVPVQQDNYTKYERDDLYMAKGGLMFSKYHIFINSSENNISRLSHILIDELEAFQVKSQVDLMVANLLYNQKK
jgi:CMP-N-acetylneuraminic acid synthetase